MWEEISIAVALISSILVILVLTKLFSLQKSVSEMKNTFDVTTAAVAAPANMLNQVANSLSQNAMTLSSSIADVNTQIGNIGQQAIKIETLGKKYEETEASPAECTT